MKEVRYLKVDAFSSGPSPGNPAGVVYLGDLGDLTPEEMQRIAREQKGVVSEVVFCAPIEPGAFALRYYSSEREVGFCGHGSIACLYPLMKKDRALASLDKVTISTNRGTLPVYNDLEGSDAVYIAAPVPEFLRGDATMDEIAGGLGVLPGCLGDRSGLSLIDAGLRTLIVPMIDLADLLEARPDISVLGEFCRRRAIDIVLVFSSETADRANGYRTRVFAPNFGYLEDPATGSGNSALGYHLLKHGEWDGSPLRIEQGPSRDDPNIVRLRTAPGEGGRRVLFGGNAIVRYERTLRLESGH